MLFGIIIFVLVLINIAKIAKTNISFISYFLKLKIVRDIMDFLVTVLAYNIGQTLLNRAISLPISGIIGRNGS